MGYWAFELFQNDTDQDMLCDMAAEAGVEALLHPDDPVAVRSKLNDGTLKRMLNKRKVPGFESEYLFELCRASNAEHEFCILAAAAMTVGAKFHEEDLAHIRNVYKSAELLREGEAQMEVALQGYKNDGTPWDFQPVLEPEPEEPVAPGGIHMLNKHHPGSFMHHMFNNPAAMEKMREAMRSTGWTGPRPSASTAPTQENKPPMPKYSPDVCANCNKAPDNLKRCAKCACAFYCSRDCQKEHWKKHKKDCAALAQQRSSSSEE